MNLIQNEVMKRERLYPVYSYPYKVVPLSEQGKLAFAHYANERGSVKEVWTLVKDNPALDKQPFVGECSFYHDDPKESEEALKSVTIEHAIWNMAEKGVPGISHMHSGRRSYYVALKRGEDYEVIMGEKVAHDPPKELSFNDIKAL